MTNLAKYLPTTPITLSLGDVSVLLQLAGMADLPTDATTWLNEMAVRVEAQAIEGRR